MLKRIIAIIAAAALTAALSSCSPGKSSGKGNAGDDLNGKAYAQQPFDGAAMQGVLNPAVNSAGELVTVSQEDGKAAVITTWDGEGKQKSAVTTDVTDPVTQFALGAKDEGYLLTTPQDGKQSVHVLDASGKTAGTIPLDGLQNAGAQLQVSGQSGDGEEKSGGPGLQMVTGMQAAPDGGVFIAAVGAGVLQFDGSGKQVRGFGEKAMASYITLNGKNQLVIYSQGNGSPALKTYDTSSGREVSSADTAGIANLRSLFFDKQGDRLLYMTDADIRALSADGKTSTVLAKFSDFSLMDGTRQLAGFAVDGKGTIYLTANNSSNSGDASSGKSGPSSALMGKGGTVMVGQSSGANEMIRLGLVDASTIKERKTITMAAINGSQILNQAISAFQKAHPEYKIDLKVYNTQAQGMQQYTTKAAGLKPSGTDQVDLTSFVQALNTDLMSGNGADIIVLDDLPWYKYADKGLLVDMGKLMGDKQFDLSGYFTNILDACKVGGKLYGVPASFSYSVLTGKSSAMPGSAHPTLTEFLAKAKALPEGIAAFAKQDATQIFESYLAYSYAGLVDTANHTAHFDSPEFIQAMKDFKELIGENSGTEDDQDPQAAQLNGDVAYNIAPMAEPMSLTMQRAILGDDMKYTSVPTLGGEKSNAFTASLMMGINASSGNADVAWEFIKSVLSTDLQDSGSLGGYPVLKSSAQKRIDNMKSGTTLGKGGARLTIRMGDKQIEAKPLTDADYQSIQDTLPALNTLQAVDPNVQKIVGEELPTFFSGQKTAEEVAALIQNRVNTLLNE